MSKANILSEKALVVFEAMREIVAEKGKNGFTPAEVRAKLEDQMSAGSVNSLLGKVYGKAPNEVGLGLAFKANAETDGATELIYIREDVTREACPVFDNAGGYED